MRFDIEVSGYLRLVHSIRGWLSQLSVCYLYKGGFGLIYIVFVSLI